MTSNFRALAVLSVLGLAPWVGAEPPRCLDERLIIELVAREPKIVTPTGIAVDEQGRVWVIENNTHERPENYRGASSDRVRIFSDYDANGRARHAQTFAEGFRNAMSLALGKNGAVFLATRSAIYRLRDTTGKGIADERQVIVKLDTPGNYPHNGLSGFAFDPLGNLYFSLGENLGAPYKLIGSDSSTQTGGGEGGSIYRCRPDGSRLVRVATGFWNTFHLGFDAFGRLFAVDNDPDSRGPCRLMHIVPGGDYGYRFRNGRKGLHPFTAWDGELPGTLPMVAGTSEAPCGIVAYESNGLPPEYRGQLLVTSWGDHVVERYQLTPKGASFTSRAQPFVHGGEDFRPVGMVTGPDGSLYLSDWVDKSYPVHGKGRIWRIRMRKYPRDDGLRVSSVAQLGSTQLQRLVHDPRQEIRAAAGEALAQKGEVGIQILSKLFTSQADPKERLQALWALARTKPERARGLLLAGLRDKTPEVRGESVRLVGELSIGAVENSLNAKVRSAAIQDPSPFVRMQAILQLTKESRLTSLVPSLADEDPFVRGAALASFGNPGKSHALLAHAQASDPRLRIGILLALRRAGEPEGRTALPRFLADPDPGVRRAAIQWIGEDRLRQFASQLQPAAARPPVTREVFEAWLAANEFLRNEKRKPDDEWSGEEYVARIVQDPGQPSSLRTLALRMLRPDHAVLQLALLKQLLQSQDAELRAETVRTLAQRGDEPAQAELRRLAKDPKLSKPLRAEVILGLAHSVPDSSATRKLLLSLLPQPGLRTEVWRSLRVGLPDGESERTLHGWGEKLATDRTLSTSEREELAEQLLLVVRSTGTSDATLRGVLAGVLIIRPKNESDWRAALAGPADAAAGERVFFHIRGPRCFACHRVDGRGGRIGPDLSRIGRSTSRDKLIESILAPSKEIAPQFVSWQITTRDGRVRTGVIVDEGPHSTITIANAEGKLDVIHRTAIEERHALPTSIMPDNLHELMTRQEFRDLLAFLTARR